MQRRLLDRHAGRLGGVLEVRLGRFVLEQLAVHAADAAHRLDHVNRHADRAALVGDRPRDRLANPPRGVGRELVAAGRLELVDRPHQARVAFLDEVQEAQAAVAIAFGDGDDQPQIAGREPPLGRFVLAGQGVDAVDAAAERARAFQRDPHQAAEFFLQARPARRRAPVPFNSWRSARISSICRRICLTFSRIGCKRCVRRPSSSISRTARPRRAISRRQACAALLHRPALADGDAKVLAVFGHDVVQRPHVRLQDLDQPLLFADVDD